MQPVNTEVAPNQTATTTTAPATDTRPKHLTIDTNSNADRANYQKATAANPTPTPIVNPEKLHEKPAGPPGFVTKDGTILYADHKTSSAQLATMKRGENVYILKMTMEDENGQILSVPTWYKVQRKTKKQETGWVQGKLLDSGGGG